MTSLLFLPLPIVLLSVVYGWWMVGLFLNVYFLFGVFTGTLCIMSSDVSSIFLMCIDFSFSVFCLATLKMAGK
jgi:hypothetical protein